MPSRVLWPLYIVRKRPKCNWLILVKLLRDANANTDADAHLDRGIA